jgi:hypothetical protein
MSKPENDANNIFRPSDSPLTEYEKEQIALRKNLERLRAERLAREAANAGHSPKQKDRRSDRRSFRWHVIGIDALDFALAYDLATVGLSLLGAGGCENLSIKPNFALRRRWKRIKWARLT